MHDRRSPPRPGHVVSAERVIAAPAGDIFDLLADAGSHPAIDGSGTVRSARAGAGRRLGLGSRFTMAMRAGVSYDMVNTVVEFDERRRIAWQARPTGPLGSVIGGRVWRYELEAAGAGTRVRESWDVSRDRQRRLLLVGRRPERTRRAMEATLERIAGLVEAPEA